jgi:trimethylamine--corrinoid protein Co-methyltransferase
MSDALGGANLIHDLGYLESGLCGSLSQLTICDEIVGWIRHVMKPVSVDDNSLALDLINDKGPDGDFLDTDHTLTHYRERYYPVLFDRSNHDQWLSRGGERLSAKAAEQVEELLASHTAQPLEPDAARAVRLLVQRATERSGS